MMIIDLSRFHPKLNPIALPSWDQMLTWQHDSPSWPAWPILHWPAQTAVTQWKKHIPQWVQETILRFPKRNHLQMLYLSAKYPQMLEILEKMPLLAWRIAEKNLDEPTLKQLFTRPRVHLTEAVHWPKQKETTRFLQKLRLRSMDQHIIHQVEQCLHQPEVLTQACHLPRINSMALTLAAQFPQLIDTPLHHSLARQPCRPEQCKQLHATLSDAIKLAQWLDKSLSVIEKCRFEVEVVQIYQQWLQEGLKTWKENGQEKLHLENSGETPCPKSWKRITTIEIAQACTDTHHAWFIEAQQGYQLYQHKQKPLIVAIHHEQPIIVRQADNKLPTTEQQAEIALLQAQLARKTNASNA